jgi:sarcosine oxidase, subunit beta
MLHSLHVAVIGAGTLGLCTAINLIERGARVTVLEAQSIASGSSGRSVGVIGTQFADPFQIMLRKHALRQFRRWETLGLRFNHIGYLRLARTEAQMARFETSVRLQAAAGFRAIVYRADQLTDLAPHLDPAGLAGGLFGPDDGFIDPHQLCTMLAEMARAQGSEIQQFCKVEGCVRVAGGYRLATSKGDLSCDAVVNAAGAWASPVAAMLGQTLNVYPERHEAITIMLDRPLGYIMPMVMDLVDGEGTGLNFRHDTDRQLIAEVHQSSAAAPENPDAYNDQCDEQSKTTLAELLLQRLPGLSEARLGRGWAGLYPTTADRLPYVGPADLREPSLVTAAGAGGYGIQLAPVIGQIAADWVVHGAPISAPEAERLAPSAKRQ